MLSLMKQVLAPIYPIPSQSPKMILTITSFTMHTAPCSTGTQRCTATVLIPVFTVPSTDTGHTIANVKYVHITFHQ